MKDKRTFEPGSLVRVEHTARIVERCDESNPYWYFVEYADGKREGVNISRIRQLEDSPRANVDDDGSLYIFSPRLSPAGAVNLYHFLRTNLHEFEAQLEQEG